MLTSIAKSIMRTIWYEWHKEGRLHMKKIAWRYSDRMLMDGSVIRKTGEVIPRESA